MFNLNCIYWITAITILQLASSDNNNNNNNNNNIDNIVRYKRTSYRIFGGENAEAGKYPFIVSIRNHRGNHSCGGFILKPNFIVTAAHCLQHRETNNFLVNTGSHLLNSGGVSHPIESVKSYFNFSLNNVLEDIGLIKLKSPIEFNDLTKPIEIGLDELPPNSDVTLIGWGRTRGYKVPKRLQKIELKTIALDECVKAMAKIDKVTDKQICTFTQFDQGACFGDSGGPLFRNDKVYGVVSWGYPCAIGYPDIFTKLSSYNNWIEETMASM